MPRRFLAAFALLIVAVSSNFAANSAASLLDQNGNPAGFRTLAIGDAAPDFALPGIDGRTYRLADFAGPDVLMVLFTSNHCPTSHSIERRLQKLRDDLRSRSFALVAINPNHPDGLSTDELGYGEFGDSFAEMKPYAKSLGWDFPYIYDGDTQLVARAYGCLATPHVFIFDQARRLRYAGSFDDSRFYDDSTVKVAHARNAIEAMLAGRPVPVELTKPFGCSTK
ncbi:MAG: thioredoxin family protein, partial [Opitutus sp.]|nr:thioredoxin family protein [Opitutus sp.]